MDPVACKQLLDVGFDPEWLTGIGESATALAVIIGGIWGLRQYREDQRLKAANMLLEMEKEFRELGDICNKIEVVRIYEGSLKPILARFNSEGSEKVILTDPERETVKDLDRVLRFFYVCTVLNGELQVEQDVIGRVYYYWLCLLAEPGQRADLYAYIEKYYKRLHDWLNDNKSNLYKYRDEGVPKKVWWRW